MNFSNQNLLIIIALISIVIMFLTSDSICKNQEQFDDSDNARRIGQIGSLGPSDLPSILNTDRVCDAIKCGRNPEICTGDICLPVTTGGGCKQVKCSKTDTGCFNGYRIKCDPIKIDSCGKRSPKICTPGAAKCC
jgi:hypothetical protein